MPHNGGRSQVNLNFLFNSGEYAFLNLLKITETGWNPVSPGNSPITPDMLDADGYPTTLTNTLGVNLGSTGGIYTQILAAPQSSRPGNYVVTWDGNGTIYASAATGSISTESGSKTSSSGSGRYVFSTSDTNNFLIGIASIGSPRITNMQVFHEDDEDAIIAGEVFGTKLKERLIEANFGVIRVLNWLGTGNGGANFANTTTWNTRKPLGYFTYGGHEMRSDFYCGVTSNSGNDYTADAPAICSATGEAWDGVLRDKTTVHVVFNESATQSGTCSLDVDGTGAINVLGSGSTPLSDAITRYPVGGTYQSLATLVYDAALNAWIKRGGDAASATQGIASGVPPELLIQLCEEVGAHISVPVPFLTLTPATDWLPKFLELYKSAAPSWMVIWLEGPNELWNPLFLGLGYSEAVSTAYSWSADSHNWYGKALSHIGQIASFMFDDDRTKYRVMCGVQTIGASSPGGIANSNPRLSSAKYVANTGGLQGAQTLAGSWGTINISASSGVAEAWRWTTHVTVANYIAPASRGATSGAIKESDLATAFAGGDLTAPATYIDGLDPPYAAVTFVDGTPGQVEWQGHPLSEDEPLYFLYGHPGTLSGTPSSASVRFVKEVIDADHFTISSTVGGTAANLTVTGSGEAYAFAATDRAVIPAIATLHRNWKAWAQSFGVQKMCGYEGGFSPDYTGGGTSDLDELRAAGKLVTSSPNNPLGLLGYTQDNYEAFLGLTDDTFTAEFPSCFQLGGKTPSTNVWSVLEDVYQTPDPPQWDAIRLFNARLRRVRLVATA